MEGGFSFPFGGDPEELMRSLQEFAAQQAESVAEAQCEQFATLTLNTAVELTAAALQRVETSGATDVQAMALRDAMRVLFPEAVALVRTQLKNSITDVDQYLFISSLDLQAGRPPAAIEAARKALDLLATAEREDMTAALITLASAQEERGRVYRITEPASV